MLVDIHPDIALSILVRDIKQWSSRWLSANPDFQRFDGWAEGYYAASLSRKDVDACKQYIINQENHHKGRPFDDELRAFALDNGLTWYQGDCE